MKFLIVEDEILIQKSLKKFIEKKGHEVLATSNGTEAITMILENNFDRIICDLMLQDISGFDIIEASKKKLSAEQIAKVFVIITAYSSDQVLKQARQYGCQIFNKPFQDIRSTINAFIGES